MRPEPRRHTQSLWPLEEELRERAERGRGGVNPRVAIVHDQLVDFGEAERVVEALHSLWPSAPVFTSLFDPDAMPASFGAMDVRTTFMQRLPGLRRRQLGLPLYPAAMRSLDLSGFDLVLSSSSGWAHGVLADDDATHLVYCHTPARWLYRSKSYPRSHRLLASPLRPALRRWDQRSAARPTRYVANSAAVRDRILRHYGRPARVVYPPLETRRFSIGTPEDFYLCVARLTPSERIDLAVETTRRLGLRLLVAGDGPAVPTLRRLAGPMTEFLGQVGESELAELLSRCRALIVPGEEDFCITAVEAMASGRPVVAYARGAAAETVLPDRTGVLFATQTPDFLAAALARLERVAPTPEAVRSHSLQFDVSRFHAEMRAIAAEALGSTLSAAA